jgi:hypothetical protein
MDWQLQKDLGWCECGPWCVKLKPLDPGHGLSLFRGNELTWNLLRVKPLPRHALHLQEAYVRQEDLILRYEQSQSDQFGFQLNWRRLDCELVDAIAIELWLSVQTTLLNTHPMFEIDSTAHGNWQTLTLAQLSCSKAQVTAAGCSRDQSLTTIVMIQDSDACQAKLIKDKSAKELRFRMFGQFLEKGVIRRARLCFLATTADLSQAEIAEAYQKFSASPLPLTA